MTSLSLTLLIVSAFLHASWNFIAKNSGRDNLDTFKIALTVGALLLLPFMLMNSGLLFSIDLMGVIILVTAGFFQFIYFFSLKHSYFRGDLSLVYPIVRSVPVVLVACIRIIFFGTKLGPLVIGGVVLIVAGCFILPFTELNRDNIERFFKSFHLYIFLTIIGTTGYTLVDDAGLRYMAGIMPDTSPFLRSVNYLFLENLSTLIWMFTVTFRTTDLSTFRNPTLLKNGAIMGAGISITYLLVLIAMNFVTDISYVAAMRQLSIPIGAIIGFIILKEPRHYPRVLGILLILSGLFAVSL